MSGKHELYEWWDKAHRNDNRSLLSGYRGTEIWSCLDIQDLLHDGASVLDVGVGLGCNAIDLAEAGCSVSVLDISPIALDRVASLAKGYLSSQLDQLPLNTFDVAMSHLVAQHMNDLDLERQIAAVASSLKLDGVFAMQFATNLDGIHDESSEMQKCGGVCRSPKQMEAIALAANARQVRLIERNIFPEYRSQWYVSHLVKN